MIAPTSLISNVAAVKPSPLPPYAFYRSVSLHVLASLGVHPLDGKNAGEGGGRYNAPGSPPTCYFAGCQTIAAFECEQAAMVMNLATVPLQPRVTFAVTVSGAQVLDLTQGLVLATLGVAHEELMVPTARWQHQNDNGALSVTQQLAGIVRRSRQDIDGLLVPSWLSSLLLSDLIPRTENLVLFMDPASPWSPRRPGVAVTLHDASNLLPK